MSLIRLLHCAAALLAIGAHAAVAQTTPSELSTRCSDYDSVPLPAESSGQNVPKAFPDCASYRSYRGIGRPVNYDEARACAWQERLAQQVDLRANDATAGFVGGSLILADIYFNGAGVKPDIPVAIRFACESEPAMAKLALADIVKLNGDPPAHPPFEFCDYAASTFTGNFCTAYAADIEDDRRSRDFAALKQSMTPAQSAAFENLLAAMNAYVGKHAKEVDQNGTIRGMRTIRSQQILKDLFHGEVMDFEQKRWPSLRANTLQSAEGLLRRQYQHTLQQLRDTKPFPGEQAITPEDVTAVQKSWQAYLAAWDSFARLRYPAAAAAIHSQITLDRYRLLKTIS